jgi:hypothetical protein
MTQFYKLNPDARRFFDEKFHTQVKELKWWNEQGIPVNILDEMPAVYLTFGHERDNSTALSGWDNNGAHFHFTIKIADMSSESYNKTIVPAIMDEIQKVLDRHFKNRY